MKNPTEHRCPAPDQLGRFAELPEGDGIRAEYDACPRCSSVLAAYRSFLEAGAGVSLPAGTSRRLDAWRRDHIGPAAGREAPVRAARPPRASWSWRPLWQPALAFAGLALIAAGWFVSPIGPRGDAPGAVRGEVMPEEPAQRSERFTDGGVRFEWTVVPEATRYVVELHSASLTRLASYEAGDATSLIVAADSLPAAARGGGTLFRVVAYAGADRIESSPARELAPASASGSR